MNNFGKVEAFKSFYLQAKEAYEEGNISLSKEMFLKAASLANEISLESASYDVKMEYHNQAKKILSFIKENLKNKEVAINNESEKSFDSAINNNEDKITFEDVAGLDDVKREIITNVIEPLRNPEIARSYNIKPGAKILLYGPPGTGKTYIARAIAGEIDAKFYAINCQDLISKYMGESSKMIDKLFEDAQKNKRAIIFFDEFDSIASKRESDNGSVDGEMARFVASFLTKVDGFKKPKNCEMLLLIAATNRPWSIDSAMLRGGRFDSHIYVGLPDDKARRFLIEKSFNGIQLDRNISIDELVNRFSNLGGADIVSACEKIKHLAFMRAIKNKRIEPIKLGDVDEVTPNIHPITTQLEINQFLEFKRRS